MASELLRLKPVRSGDVSRWISIGSRAYADHYTHLWPNGDPRPYTSRNFTPETVATDFSNERFVHWVIQIGPEDAGICKVDLLRNHPEFHPGGAIHLEKLYLKKEFTGRGYGSDVLELLYAYCRQNNKIAVWLDTMKEGPALQFYLKNGFRILGETAIPYPEVLPGAGAMWILGREL